ncbi:MAG: methyltransferase domain-containing protein [Candidatus Omnitrophota bacterium]
MKTSENKSQLLEYNYLTRKQYSQEEVRTVNCPFCNSNEYKIITIERTVLGIVKCKICGLIYVNPRLKAPEKIYWGNSNDYYEEARLIFSGGRQHHRDRNYSDDLKTIARFKPAGNFLDIGTNAGFFLRLARKNNNWNIYGIEPSESLANLGRKYFNLNIKNAFLEDSDFPDNFFDIVTMTDVFEHISDPKIILNKVHKIIKDDGILFIKVPNGLFNLTKLRLARLTGNVKSYDIFDSYEHLVHYSHDTLTKMLQKHGFCVIHKSIGKPIQTPVWMDYVGRYYQYPTPWVLDYKNHILRNIFYFAGLMEYFLLGFKAGWFAPNIIIVAKKV